MHQGKPLYREASPGWQAAVVLAYPDMRSRWQPFERGPPLACVVTTIGEAFLVIGLELHRNRCAFATWCGMES